MRILTSLQLKVKLAIIIEIYDTGTVYFINKWSVGGRTRHVNTCKLFLFEVKWQGCFQVIWVSGYFNEVYLSARTFQVPFFKNHCVKLNGEE